jgi:hypothetical protein
MGTAMYTPLGIFVRFCVSSIAVRRLIWILPSNGIKTTLPPYTFSDMRLEKLE